MKKSLLLLSVAMVIFGCKNSTKTSQDEIKDAASALQTAKIVGAYTGEFGRNNITLLITKAQNDTVQGRSVVGGDDRPFLGVISEKDGMYSITAKEPGDNSNDGIFNFTIKKESPDVVNGSWTPNDKAKDVKNYSLRRKAFSYRTDVGAYPEASQRLLKAEDIENFGKTELTTMRNEIYARHGYCFGNRAMRDHFENLNWYIPDNTDVRNKLTNIEKENIVLIKQYEQFSEEYGDDFGR